jgi:hypothetical protein
MKKALLFLTFIAFASCNNKENNTDGINQLNTEPTKTVKKNDNLIIDIDLETSEPEDIKLMTINTFLNNGQFLDLFIIQKLNANETVKEIHFELPDNIYPDHLLGISFGPNKIKEVKINSINLAFKEESIKIESDEILNYFRTNKFVDYDESSNSFKTKTVDGQHNPIIFLRQKYIDKIQGLN